MSFAAAQRDDGRINKRQLRTRAVNEGNHRRRTAKFRPGVRLPTQRHRRTLVATPCGSFRML